jgi:hypothetical protein
MNVVIHGSTSIVKHMVIYCVLYGYEAWSLTLREELRLKAFENRVLRRVFGPNRDEGTGEWRKLHEEYICTFYPILCGW